MLPSAFRVVNITDGDLAKYRSEIPTASPGTVGPHVPRLVQDHRNDRVKNLYQDVKEKSERRQARTMRACRFAGRNQRKASQ